MVFTVVYTFFLIFMQLYQCCNAYECDYNVPKYVQVQLFCSHGYYRMKLWTTLCKMNFKDQISGKKIKIMMKLGVSQCQLCRNTTII